MFGCWIHRCRHTQRRWMARLLLQQVLMQCWVLVPENVAGRCGCSCVWETFEQIVPKLAGVALISPPSWPSPPLVLRPPLPADSFPKPGFVRRRMNPFEQPSTARLRGAVGDQSPSGRSSKVALQIGPALRADAHAREAVAHPRRRSHSGLWSPAGEGSQVGGLRSSAS